MENYRSIFIAAKQEIDRKIGILKTDEKILNFLKNTLKEEIFKCEKEIREDFDKVKCKNCGKCCRFAMSEFSPEELKEKAKNGDKTAKSFIETFTLYKENEIPKEFLNLKKEGAFCYHCEKVEFKNGKYFCPKYQTRPDICKNYPDTPLEPLPEGCAYTEWKTKNESKALGLKAQNEIRKFYLEELRKDDGKNLGGVV